MASEPAAERDQRFVAGVAFSRTVQEVIDRVLTRPGRTRPLQTGELLAALAEADTDGDWVRVWPSYEGGADALLAAAADTGYQPSGHSWRGVPLSRDLLAALRLLTVMAGRYEMDPVQLGAVVLALAADPGTGAARHLGRLSGCDHAELLDRIQSDLVGVTLEGFGDLAGQLGGPEGAAAGGKAPRWQIITRWIAAVYCIWVAWLALRAGTGNAIAVGIVGVTVIISMMAALSSWLAVPTAGWDPRKWVIKWRPQYTSRWFILGLGVLALFWFVGLQSRHRHPFLGTPNLLLLVGGSAAFLCQASFSISARGPVTRPRGGSPSWGRLHYEALFEVPIIMAAGLGLVAWYAHLGLVVLRVPAFDVPWQTHVLAWIRRVLTDAYLGRFFGHGYWPLLIMAVVLAGCYFCALAAQLVMTRVARRAAIFAACSAAAGLLIVAFSYPSLLSGPRGGAQPAARAPVSTALCPTISACTASWRAALRTARGSITAVSCTGQACVAVGTAGPRGRRSGYALSYRHGTWSRLARLGAGSYHVSCPAAVYCVAVSTAGRAYTLHGHRWSGPRDIDRAAGTGPRANGPVDAVSCASPRFCVAVTATGQGLAWDGTGWSRPRPMGLPGLAPPAVPGQPGQVAVSCPAAGFCFAGTGIDAFQAPSATGNGRRWTPTPPGPVRSANWQVSCASRSFCMVVGGDHADGDVSAIWNGQGWSPLPPPAQAGPALGFSQVSCLQPGFCVAIDAGAGLNGSTAGQRGSAIFTWFRGAWNGPELVDAEGQLGAISCSVTGLCAAADNRGYVFVN